MTDPKPPYIIRPLAVYAIFRPVKLLILAMAILVASSFLRPYLPGDILKYSVSVIVAALVSGYILRYIFISGQTYTITDEKITYRRGVFSITTDYIELYRVMDYTEHRSFLLRLIGGMDFTLDTMDKSHPVFTFCGIPASDLEERVRALVEENRSKKRVFVTE